MINHNVIIWYRIYKEFEIPCSATGYLQSQEAIIKEQNLQLASLDL